MLRIETTRDAKGKVLTAKVLPEETGWKQGHENRNDWKTFAAAEEIAKVLGAEFIATDAGEWVSPRYDVQRLPKVGEKVSYTFNGDTYPCGIIESVSKAAGHRRIVADENGTKHVFWRRRLSGSWVKDGTWSLTGGHINERNPSF